MSAAVFGDVVAANVVGYSTRPMQAEFRLMTFQFQGMDGNYYLNDVVPYHSNTAVDWTKTGKKKKDSFANAPQIKILDINGNNPQQYFYVTNARKIVSGVQTDTEVAGWCDQNGNFADSENSSYPGLIVPGSAVWFKDSDNETVEVTSNGQVGSETIDIIVGTEFRPKGCPFPIELNLNSSLVQYIDIVPGTVDWTKTGKKKKDSFAEAPQIKIQVYTGTSDSPAQYFYVTNARKIKEGVQTSEEVLGWCDQNGNYADAENTSYVGNIQLNGACWMRGNTKVGEESGFTMRVTSPLAK